MARTEHQIKSNRLTVRARARAMAKLVLIFPEEFNRLHNEERANVGLPPIANRRMSVEELAKAHGMKLVPIDA